MLLRWVTGLLLGGAALLAAWFSPLSWSLFVFLLLGLAAFEWSHLSNVPGAVYLITLEAALILLSVKRYEALPLLLVIPTLWVLYHREPKRAHGIIWTAAGIVWLALPAALLIFVRTEFGFELLLVLLAGTALQDTFALYSGKMFGGERPYTPVISPNKTWAGFFGSLLGMVGTFLVAGYYFEWPPIYGIVIGVILGVLGQVGDLSISALKRRAEVKDTGSLFPGHGGILDRVDGLLFNVSAFYLFCLYLDDLI